MFSGVRRQIGDRSWDVKDRFPFGNAVTQVFFWDKDPGSLFQNKLQQTGSSRTTKRPFGFGQGLSRIHSIRGQAVLKSWIDHLSATWETLINILLGVGRQRIRRKMFQRNFGCGAAGQLRISNSKFEARSHFSKHMIRLSQDRRGIKL